jgi:hypothetical protein
VSPARLSQVVLSLLLSARRALPDGGVVTLRLERDGEWAVATVSDDGLEREWGLELDAALDVARMHGGDLVLLPSVHAGGALVLRIPLLGAGHTAMLEPPAPRPRDDLGAPEEVAP